MFEKLKGKKVFVCCSLFNQSNESRIVRAKYNTGYTGVLTDYNDDWIMLDDKIIINIKYIIKVESKN